MKINLSDLVEYLPLLLMGAVYILSQVLFKKKPKNLYKTTEKEKVLSEENPTYQYSTPNSEPEQYFDETSETFFEQVYGDPKPTPTEPSPLDIATAQPENQQLSKLELFQKALDIEESPHSSKIPNSSNSIKPRLSAKSSNLSNPYEQSNFSKAPSLKNNQLNAYTTHLKKLSNAKNFKQTFILKELLDPPKSMR